MSKLTILVIAFECASAFLIQDFKYNQTSSQSSIGQHTSVEESIRDLMTLITDEKRIRFQLENRLKTAEDKIDKMDQYNIAVSNELEKEKNKVEQLEIMLDKVVREMERNTTAVSNEVEKEKYEVEQLEIMLDKVVREMERNATAVSNEVEKENYKVKQLEIMLVAVSNEVEKENYRVEQLEIMLDKVVREMERNTSANCDCLMGNGSISVKAAMENIMHDIVIVREKEKRILDDTTELNNTLVSLRDDNLRTIERTKLDLSNITNSINSSLSDKILDINRQLKIANASSQLDAIRELKDVTSQLNITLSDTVMNKTWLIQMQNSTLKSVQDESVGFTVNIPDTSAGYDLVMFTHEEYNDHNVYNMTSGKFVCKQGGLYYFTLSIVKSTSSAQITCYFNKNGKIQSTAFTYLNALSVQYTSTTNSILYQLHTGDEVYVSKCIGVNYLSRETSFTGFLVSPTY